ncbi:TadE/TadG family type IV pilus assembly protein [Cellulosimicrobium sp. CUA-896]|uniref:TadE/TadG family type IV pilus assembly protein n=1 Tax=Cellulosimicrobium sp. CUA-896 TaxID=1517881 RepID=UPI0009650F6A|nr:TadE/TadG family type IV pilus assembly protein [Cellulosimicrobium sp. CUA-896]OLT54348.1 pilus assembly protein TadE [Cellulosimicrobium sp. CUA-896]
MQGASEHERGSAVVDFTLVSVLVLVLFLGVVQVALAVHVRSMIIDCAAEGARVAGRADRGPSDGVARTQELIAASLSSRYAQDVTARQSTVDGLAVVEVTVTAPLPVVGLLGPSGAVTVSGHALEEGA